MFRYPYRADGDHPNMHTLLLSSVCCPLDESAPPPTSLPSPNGYFMINRSSTDRLPPFSASPARDFHRSEPVRRVYSTGDLIQEGEPVALTGRSVGRYTAEERKERIERYRSKRSQRNFHKKITYNCRKTLADSRPRVRGRFARNGETEIETEPESSKTVFRYYEHDACVDGRDCNDFDGSDDGGDWLKQMQAALATTDDEEVCHYEDDIWAGLDSVFAIDLL